jgi:hypothetical protein
MWQRMSTQHLKNAADNQHALEQRFFEHRFHPEHDVMYHITEIETIANQLRDINAPVTESQIMTKIIQPGLTQRDKWFCRTRFLSLTKGPIVVPTLFFLLLGLSGEGLSIVFCS